MSTRISDKKKNEFVADGDFKSKNADTDSDSTINGKSNKKDDLEELRFLLVKPEEVSEVLPHAVKKSTEKNDSLAEATLPVVEENIRQSAVRNPKILAEALFPVIGPAIRKAIAQALGSMVQSLNQTLEYSISPKGLSWRLEALRAGKSFGEIVILKTLLYRVEQVFLIHKDTGLLLQHVVADSKDVEDADMVSAMLTAIEDFVQDSFKTSPNATLDSLKIKELSVWIEHSPDAVLAAVIRGTPPLSLRDTLSEVIEEIQYKFETELKNFNGQPEIFEDSRTSLERCLQFQTNEETKKKTIFSPINILAGLLGFLLLVGGFFYIRDYMRWSNYVARLKAEPGIVVAESDHGIFSHSISGLRDPLALDPKSLLSEYNLDEGDVSQSWKSYYDMSSDLVVRRAEKLLEPPDTIRLKFENGTLSADGKATVDWFEKARKKSLTLVGVSDFRAYERLAIKSRLESEKIMFTCNTVEVVDTDRINSIVMDIEKLADTTQNLKVRIFGFSSNSGTVETNADIRESRAEKIKSELVKRSSKLEKLQRLNPAFIKIGHEKNGNDNDCKVELKITFD